jgi:3-oxoacyl-[acyl-carrier-protein] synthase II
MGASSTPAVLAAVLAERDAVSRGAHPEVPPSRRGVALGTGFGPVSATGAILEMLAREGPAGAEPFLFVESLHNSAAGHAAIVLECRGPTVTPVQGDASGIAAAILGSRWIRDDRADRVYAGGAEELSPFLLRILARLQPPRRSLPLLGEGAGVVRLDSEPGDRPFARVVATAIGHDPAAGDLEYGSDTAAPRRVLDRLLREAKWSASQVDLVVTGENGFPRLADLERRVWAEWSVETGDSLPRRIAPANIFGALAGSGSFGLAAACLDLEAGRARRALVCIPAWGGTCQGLALSAVTG